SLALGGLAGILSARGVSFRDMLSWEKIRSKWLLRVARVPVASQRPARQWDDPRTNRTRQYRDLSWIHVRHRPPGPTRPSPPPQEPPPLAVSKRPALFLGYHLKNRADGCGCRLVRVSLPPAIRRVIHPVDRSRFPIMTGFPPHKSAAG